MSALMRWCSPVWLLFLALGLPGVAEVRAAMPSCPSGYQLEADGSKCVHETTPTCPTGYDWVQASGICRAVATLPSSCPEGGTLSTTLSKCVLKAEPIITCPEGYTYGTLPNSSQKTCKRLLTPSCPNNFHWDQQHRACTSSTSSGTRICPDGSSYNPDKKMCEESRTPSCQAGYTLSKGQCTKRMTTYQ